MKHLSRIKQVAYLASLSLLLLLAGMIVAGRLGIGGFRALVVQSGSMEPAIRTKSIVLVAPATDYQTGDVITFKQSGREQVLVTHRVESMSDTQPITFVTKGDANEEADVEAVPLQDVVGKVRLSIPWLGGLVSFAQSTPGFIGLVIVPAVLIVYSEILNIKNQLVNMHKQKTKTNYFRSV